MDELVVPRELWRNRTRNPETVMDGAVWLIDHMCEHVGIPDLGAVDVLDFGCGVRFTQVLLNRGLPIKHYVGVDVSHEVVDFLRTNVSDPRFEYYYLNAHNDLYNPTGEPLSTLTVPEIEGRRFDLICLFSVFTHLAPDDYASMLRLLHRFVKPDGRLFFTVFIDERTDGGHGYIDRLAAALETSDSPQLEAAIASGLAEPADFRDADPRAPLRVALYSRRHALDLVEQAGWRVLEVSAPDVHLQHHIVCAP